MHNDISAKQCENCNMIMVNYADLWTVHTQVASQHKGAKLELKEFKARSLLLGACTSCSILKSDLEAYSIEIMELKQRVDHSSCRCFLHGQDTGWLRSPVPVPRWSYELESTLWFILVQAPPWRL
jgi:hypothetical protein